MEEKNAQVWLEEFHGNPSVVALCYSGGAEGGEAAIGLTKHGVEVTIDLLQEWLIYHDERMEQLFADLGGLDV